MSKTDIREKVFFVWYAIGLIVLIVSILWILSHFKDIIAILIICTLLSYLLSPIVDFLSNPMNLEVKNYLKINKFKIKLPWNTIVIKTKRGNPRLVAVLAAFIIVGILLALMIFYIVPTISQEYKNLYEHRAIYKQSIFQMYTGIINYIDLHTPTSLKPYLPELSKGVDPNEIIRYTRNLIASSLPAVGTFMSSLAHFILVPFITFYILMDYDIYKKGLLSLIPGRRQNEVIELLKNTDRMLKHYIRGQLLVCLTIGASVTIAMLIMKIPYAILIGIFAGIVDVIPYIGVILSMIPAIIFALFKSPVYALAVFLVLYAIHWFEGHVIIPNIMGQSIDLPPLTIIIAIIIGAEAMGLIGVFLAVPIAAVIKVVISYYIDKKEEQEAVNDIVSDNIV